MGLPFVDNAHKRSDGAWRSCRDEGGADGGIVVQDCMQLLNNLLQGNQPNQLMFRWDHPAALQYILSTGLLVFDSSPQNFECHREMGYLQALPAFLKVQGNQAVSKQKAANLSCGILTIHCLMSDSAVGLWMMYQG